MTTSCVPKPAWRTASQRPLGCRAMIDGKVAERELLAGRPQRPLVGQANHPARLQARQHGPRLLLSGS